MQCLLLLLACAVGGNYSVPRGWTMVQRPTIEPYLITSIQGRFLAASSAGVVQTSDDGGTWKRQDLPDVSCLNAFANTGAAVALLGCGTASVSTDGKSWQNVPLDGKANVIAAIATDSAAIAVTDSGRIFRSDRQLLTWTPLPAASPVGTKAVVWNGSAWVAFTDSGEVATSPDAQTWTTVVRRGPTGVRNASVFKGRYYVRSSRTGMMQSDDLMYWTTLDSVSNVYVAGDRIVKSPGYSNLVPLWSSNGTKWSRFGYSSYSGITGFAKGDSGFMYFSGFGTYRMDTAFQIDWTSRLQHFAWNGVAACWGTPVFYGKGIFTGRVDSLGRVSPDTANVSSLACNDSVAIATESRQDSILVKGPGGWQHSKITTGNASTSLMYSSTWTGHEFLAGGDAAFISSYGNWTPGVGLQWNNEKPTSYVPNEVQSIGAHDSVLLLGGGSGRLSRAINWKSWAWAPTTFSSSDRLFGITWGNGMFVVSANDSRLMTSPDGKTWQTKHILFGTVEQDAASAVVFGAGRFFVVTPYGTVASSTDALAWDTLGTLPDGFISGSRMVVLGGKLIVAGSKGGIFTRVVDSQSVSIRHDQPTRSPRIVRRGGSYAVSAGPAATAGRLLDANGRLVEEVPLRDGQFLVQASGRKGLFLFAWSEGAPPRPMTAKLMFTGP